MKKLQGCAGHGRHLGFVRVLDNGQAARLIDLAHPSRTIAIGTCQQYRGQALLIHIGRGLKKVIDCRPRVMHRFLLTQGKTLILLHRDMVTGRGKVQGARHNRLFVLHLPDRQGHALGKHFGELAASLVGQVQHHDDRQGKISRELGKNRQQRFDSARRRADHHCRYLSVVSHRAVPGCHSLR